MDFESSRFVDITRCGRCWPVSQDRCIVIGCVLAVEASQRFSITKVIVQALAKLYRRMGCIPWDVGFSPIVSAGLPDVLNSAVM